MSVLIKNMAMPKNCSVCIAGYGGFCFIAPPESDGVCPPKCERPDWCPLVEVKAPHGRLVDGDELAAGCDSPHYCRWLSEIEDMPTILEAEG